MNLLLAGTISPLIEGMVERLERDAHHLTVLSGLEKSGKEPQPLPPNFLGMRAGRHDAQRILRNNRFNAVIFFFACQCEEPMHSAGPQGAALDELSEVLLAAEQNGVEQFILITDQRVFGSKQLPLESETPLADSPAGIMIKAAEDRVLCSPAGSMKRKIVRVTHLYMPGKEDAFFSRAIDHLKNNASMPIDAAADTPCDFLHVDDLALYFCLSLEADMPAVVHLAYGDRCTYYKASRLLKDYLPGLTFAFQDRKIREASLSTSPEARRIDWIPRHNWADELDRMATQGSQGAPIRKRLQSLQGVRTRLFGKMLPWVELGLLGFLSYWLTSLSGVYATFRVADFWLFYPILMGSLHGGLLGILSAFIACVFFGLDWANQGNDLYLLLYNTDNWLPLMTYLLAGGMFGYMHDKTNERLLMAEQKMAESDAEAAFLEKMFRQASEDRSRLQKQVLSSRDSYGRILGIIRELDAMQPEAVLMSALNVLEDVMQNHSVSIYLRFEMTAYCRLLARSRDYRGNAPRSMDISHYPLMKTPLDSGAPFFNTSLEPDYPTFCAPIMEGGRAISIIALWHVPFDQQTLHFQNLFISIIGLVESALVRTIREFRLTRGMYIEHTRIMTDKAFLNKLGIYQRMKKQGIAEFLFLKVASIGAKHTLNDMAREVGSVIRETDIVGRLNDGSYYVLLPQADENHLPELVQRFARAGLSCDLVRQEDAYV